MIIEVKIRLLAAESFGVRSMATVVETLNRKILIDPGIALDSHRHHLPPHPFQIAVCQKLRQQIIEEFSHCTDIVITHFHGDHFPLVEADKNQISFNQIKNKIQDVTFWCKGGTWISRTAQHRRKTLEENLMKPLVDPEGEIFGRFEFSQPFSHGEKRNNPNSVMMVKIHEDNEIFVFGSDIQLLERDSIEQILDWTPSILYVSGPPIYLPHIAKKFSGKIIENIQLLQQSIPISIIDHHLLRSHSGFTLLDSFQSKNSNQVICAADFMNYERVPLEASRKEIYKELPINLANSPYHVDNNEIFPKCHEWRQWKVDRFPQLKTP